MPADNATSVLGVALRITGLDEDGDPAGLTSLVTKSFISFSFTPEYEEGDEQTEKMANGDLCLSYKHPNVFKRATLSLSLCDPDPYTHLLMAGGTALGVENLGWAAPLSGDSPAAPVAIEVWSKAIVGGRQASVNPYWHYVFPYARMQLSGDRAMENGRMGVEFAGYSEGNASLGAVLTTADEAPWTYTTGSAIQYARAAAMPSTFGAQVVIAGA